MKSLEKRNHTLMKQNKMLQKRLAKQSADMTKKWAQLLAFLKKKNGADAIRFTRFVKDIKRFGKVHIVKKMETLQQRCIPRKRWKKRWKIGQGLVTIHVYGCPKEYPVLRTLGTAYSRYFPQNSYFQPKSGNSADRIGCCRY
jgi:hypothetical protein